MTRPNTAEAGANTRTADQHKQARRREQGRERARRHRALKKQSAQIQFVRTDANLFLHPDRLSQKAGVPKAQLRRMALKELVDNALDAASNATLTELDPDIFVIEDDGPGISPRRVVELFSVRRPMISTKLMRRPTRGMVGNGLRVATGAAFASGGKLTVESRGVQQQLSFDRGTGETVVVDSRESSVAGGTRITVEFGPAIPRDTYTTEWANVAIQLAGHSANPMLTHPRWYSEPAFSELIQAARGSAQALAENFGVDLRNASSRSVEQGHVSPVGRYVDPAGPIDQLSLDLLKSLAPRQPHLIPIPGSAFGGSFKAQRFTAEFDGAKLPAIVQAWAMETSQRDGQVDVRLIINRTPTPADLSVYTEGEAFIKGCALDWASIGRVPKGHYTLTVAVTTPAIEFISDGKTPNLAPFRIGLLNVIGSALRSAHRPARGRPNIKSAAFEVMESAYMTASARGTLPAHARQVMYAGRPAILELTGQSKLNDAYFTQTLLPAFMRENPDLTANWDVVFDGRGHLIEPHINRRVPLSTLDVRRYAEQQSIPNEYPLLSAEPGPYPTVGPGDRYRDILFLEKEGFHPHLLAARIPERFDIALMSTKGTSTVAARALVDRVSAAGGRIFVVHDLDVAGIRIFGTLGTDSERYKFCRPPNVIRLGLTFDQVQEMSLQSEPQEIQGDSRVILGRLREFGASAKELSFIAGGQRVELNAMASDQFISFVEAGLRRHGVAKLIPQAAIVEQRARQLAALHILRQNLQAVEPVVRQLAADAKLPSNLADSLRRELERDPTLSWDTALEKVLAEAGIPPRF